MNMHVPQFAALESAAPSFQIERGTTVGLGERNSLSFRRMIFERRVAKHGSQPSRLQFVGVDDGQTQFLTDVEIAFLFRDGRFHLLADRLGQAFNSAPRLLELTDQESAYCDRAKAYVDAVLGLCLCNYRSRRIMMPVIERVAHERGDKKAPGFTTVLNYIDVWLATGDLNGKACFARPKNVGRQKSLEGPMARAVAEGIRVSQTLAKGTAQDAVDAATNWLKENQPETSDEASEMPSLRTMQRYRKEVNKRIADERRFGERFAENKHGGSYERPLPDLPLQEVEVDHTPFDIILVSDDLKTYYGHPDCIAFRDRHGHFQGISIGYETPSYASFLDGLRHAIYPKDMSEYPEVEMPWYCWGRFKRLYVDNALHFIGKNIQNAAAQLKFEVVEFLPAKGSLKGAEERLLGILNSKVHNLPGSTLSNTAERRRRAEVEQPPVLTISEFRAFIVKWICDVYHITPHEGLGPLRTLKGIPWHRWKEDIDKVHIAPLPPEEDFVALAGDIDFRAINKKGIRWDHIYYQSAELEILRTHPKHKQGRTREDWAGLEHEGTKYKVTRDPFNLGFIYVENPYDYGPRVIKVPAVRQDYAAALTLHQHLVNIANCKADVLKKAKEPEEILLRARARLSEALVGLLELRNKQGIESKLARYLYQGRNQQDRSVVTTQNVSEELSRKPIDPRKPETPVVPITRSPNTTQVTLAQPPGPGAMPDQFKTSGDGLPTRLDRGSKNRPAKSEPLSATPFDLETMRQDLESDPDWSDV
jgi:putative transposase